MGSEVKGQSSEPFEVGVGVLRFRTRGEPGVLGKEYKLKKETIKILNPTQPDNHGREVKEEDNPAIIEK